MTPSLTSNNKPKMNKRQLEMINAAAKEGNLERIKELRALGYYWNDSTFITAAAYGHKSVVDWIYEQDGPWTELACEICARKGNLSMLKHLHYKLGFVVNDITFREALMKGHIEILQWLKPKLRKDYWCPSDKFWCYFATRHGNLKSLQWLLVSGCPLDLDTCLSIAQNRNHQQIYNWLYNLYGTNIPAAN